MLKTDISIIVFVYRDSVNLEECLKSIQSQNHNFSCDYVFGLTEDTDELKDKIIGYASQFLCGNYSFKVAEKHLSNQEFFFSLIDETCGEFILFCDANDYWTWPAKINLQVGFLKENPDYDLCMHDFFYCDNGTKRCYSSALGLSSESGLNGMDIVSVFQFEEWMFYSFSLIVRKKGLEHLKLPYYQSFSFVHFLYHLVKQKKAWWINIAMGIVTRDIKRKMMMPGWLEPTDIALKVLYEICQYNTDDRIALKFYLRMAALKIMLISKHKNNGYHIVKSIYRNVRDISWIATLRLWFLVTFRGRQLIKKKYDYQ